MSVRVAAETNQVEKQELLRSIPKVDEFLAWVEGETKSVPLLMVKSVIRSLLAQKRQAILAGQIQGLDDLTRDNLSFQFARLLKKKLDFNLKTVINATGVVVHTNLGRSILPACAVEFLGRVGAHYTNLEFDLAAGKRGSRYSLVEEILCELTGAESALVVNNNAAAVLLVLNTLASDKQVIVSRGELVEIGGSFRIPEVMARSGARLVEVGSTNRTHLRDYEVAINEETALLLKVHTSNYRIIGFTKDVPVEELAALGRTHDLPMMMDLGSGCLVDLRRFGLADEPTVGAVLKAGADVVTFSGDKLLGGPQAGLILGKRNLIERVKKNPLNRALRIDKFTLAALEAVLRLYFDEEKALATIPTLAMLTMSLELIRKKARRLLGRIKGRAGGKFELSIVETDSRVGGGALPEQPLSTFAVALRPLDRSVNTVEETLRTGSPPVITRIEDDRLIFDLRTVADHEISVLATIIITLFKEDSP